MGSVGEFVREYYYINDEIAYSELRSLLVEDKEPFEVRVDRILTKDFEFKLSDKYRTLLKELEYSDDLIFGKDKTLGIIAIECIGSNAYLFKVDGSVEVRKFKFWLLASERIDHNFKKLSGNLHYKYIRYFSSYEQFAKYMQMYMGMKKDVYGIWNAREQFMIHEGVTLYKGLQPKDLGVLAFDIESDGLTKSSKSEVYLITNSYRKGDVNIKKHFRLDNYTNCGELIDAWTAWVREIDPDIINFWNGYGYDLPYLEHVASLFGTNLALGRDGSNVQFKKKASQKRVDGNTSWDYFKAHIYGRQIIDGQFVALNYGVGKNYPSWGLKPIAEAEGFITPDRQFYDASKIKQNWIIPEEREKIIKYGIDDSEDTINLYFRMITSYFYTAVSVAMPFEEMMQGATGKWVNSVLVRGYLQRGYSIPKASEPQRVAGGMSYGVPGVYSNVLKYDAASYYPSTILKFNIHNPKKDPDNLFVKTVKYFTEARLNNKKLYKETGDKYYDDLQAAGKIFINSSYGVLGTSGLNFNSFEHAAEITRCCRAGLKKAVIWATGKDINHWWADYTEEQDYEGFDIIDSQSQVTFGAMPRNSYVLVNLDTDSLSFCKSDGSEFTEEEKQRIEKELKSIMYCNWEDDGEYSRVMVSKAKNYVLLPKGETKFKIKGSSLTDSKKEPALLEMLNELISSIIFKKNQEEAIYLKYCKEVLNIADIKRWCVKKSVTKKLLNGTRKNETKVLEALDEDAREGDKVWVYNAVDGQIQVISKGEPQFYKDGRPKMEVNQVLRNSNNFDGNYDVDHYLGRVYATVKILQNIIDITKFVDYSKPKNLKLRESL
jgi:DNA polymerase elongation subunit (family B)